MRVAVFALAAIAVLSGVSAYADRIAPPPSAPAAAEDSVIVQPSPMVEQQSFAGLPSAQLLSVQTTPQPTPTSVTPEPPGVVLMASGLIGAAGLLWRRRSLSR